MPRGGTWNAAAFCAAAACFLTCAPVERTAAGRPALTPVTMNIAPAINHAPIAIAAEEGFFEQEGIEARLVELDLSSTMLAASSGRLDVLSVPLRSGLFNMMLRGLPLQVVADKGHHEPEGCVASALIAPRATAQRVLASGNYRGERFALIRGGTIEFTMDLFLRGHGQSLSDVALVQIAMGEQGTSLNSEIDAVRFLSEPELTQQLQGDRYRILTAVKDVQPYQAHVLLFGRRLLQQEPDLGRRFMRAYLRGVRQYNQGKTVRNVRIVSGFTGLPPDVIRAICWQPIAGDGVVRPEAVLPFLQWARDRGYLEGDVPASRWWNPAFVDAAGRELASERL